MPLMHYANDKGGICIKAIGGIVAIARWAQRRKRRRAASGTPATRAIASGGEGRITRPCATDEQLVGAGQGACNLPSQMRGVRCGASCRRAAGREASDRGAHRQRAGEDTTADSGAGHERERTRNMSAMSVTLEASKVSGWLNADAACRDSNGGMRCGAWGGATVVQAAFRALQGSTADWGLWESEERTANM